MTTQRPEQLGDDLRKLLRRIEEIPASDLHSGVETRLTPADGKRGWTKIGASSLAAVGLAIVVAAAGWPMLSGRGGTASTPAVIETDARQPASSVEPPPLVTAGVLNPANAKPATRMPAPSSRPATKPSITIPDITAGPGERVRLTVNVEGSAADAFRVRVQGLPKGTRLTQGRFVPPDNWIVAGADLDTTEIVNESAALGRFELRGELQALDGKAWARTNSTLIVAAQTPPRPDAGMNAPGAAPMMALGDVDEQAQQKFVAQGLRQLVSGNVNSARLLFQRAAEAGNAQAALLLGDTFDEVRLAQLGVYGVLADRDKANYWYGRADELGAPEAKERLSEVNLR